MNIEVNPLKLVVIGLPVIFLLLLWNGDAERSRPEEQEAGLAQHIASMAGGRYHAQAVRQDDAHISFLLSGSDLSTPVETVSRPVDGLVRSKDTGQTFTVTFEPDPLPGDSPGNASHFVARLPEDARGKESLEVSIPEFFVVDQRFRVLFSLDAPAVHHEPMPEKVVDSEEAKLYLTPGGIYTEADIEANGRQTASERFKGFRSAHDDNPQPGDRICPITGTKANDGCTWIVGGQTYSFCCPPCVDEFITWAKLDPDKVQAADSYIQE